MKALVVGGSKGVFDDVDRALCLGEFDAVFTVNDVTFHWRGMVDFAVSLHAEKWPLWLEARKRRGLSPPARVVAHANFKRSLYKHTSPAVTDYVNHLWPEQKDSGSSGLFAVKVALDMGYDKVVVCGCPMSPEGRHFFEERPWGGAITHRKGWMQTRVTRLQDHVKSMSGWTAELLGKPTEHWLEGE